MALYAGLMSGTSLDGVDGVIADLRPAMRVLAHRHQSFPAALRAELLALNTPGGTDELHRAARAANGVARVYAAVVAELLAMAGVTSAEMRAVGAHGQTVRHRPGGLDGSGYTVQLLDAAWLAEATGIDIVADLRARDIAAGGQGAPLAPAFHAARFARPGRDSAVLNLGGIANLTLLGADATVRGFDCGPGNALLDHWVQQHLGLPFDDRGQWAGSAQSDEHLLATLLDEPFFAKAPPKSTGRDLFNPSWLEQRLAFRPELPPAVVQATLLELTARTVARALELHAPATTVLRVAGGGVRNIVLMARIAALLPQLEVASVEIDGIGPDQVEALAFAWLAMAFVTGKPGNVPAVTGAAGLRRLGALYPA